MRKMMQQQAAAQLAERQVDRDVQRLEPLTVTTAEAARLLGVNARTVQRDLVAGRLRAVKRGRSTLILMESIRAYVASLPAATFGDKRAA